MINLRGIFAHRLWHNTCLSSECLNPFKAAIAAVAVVAVAVGAAVAAAVAAVAAVAAAAVAAVAAVVAVVAAVAVAAAAVAAVAAVVAVVAAVAVAAVAAVVAVVAAVAAAAAAVAAVAATVFAAVAGSGPCCVGSGPSVLSPKCLARNVVLNFPEVVPDICRSTYTHHPKHTGTWSAARTQSGRSQEGSSPYQRLPARSLTAKQPRQPEAHCLVRLWAAPLGFEPGGLARHFELDF